MSRARAADQFSSSGWSITKRRYHASATLTKSKRAISRNVLSIRKCIWFNFKSTNWLLSRALRLFFVGARAALEQAGVRERPG
jgi:hypothetical protein